MKSLFSFGLIVLFFANIKAQSVNFKAFPNPFSQTIYFEFSLDSNATVSINIFDMIGRNVALALADTTLNAGNYQFKSTLNFLRAGVYLAKLNIGNVNFVYRILKADGATFACPLQANSIADTVLLNFSVTDSVGDSIKYGLYNRWGTAEIELDTFLAQGNYSFAFPLSGLPDGIYVQGFWQDTSDCRVAIVLGNLSAIENRLNAEKFSVNSSNNTIELKSNEPYQISVVNLLGETVLQTQTNSPFQLKSGLYFFVVKDENRNSFSVLKHWQQ